MVRLHSPYHRPHRHIALGYLFVFGLILNTLLIGWGGAENVNVTAKVGNDTTAPERPVILVPADGTTYTQTTLTVSGLAEPDTRIKLYLFDASPEFLGSVQSGAVSGSWEIPISLAEGTHTVRATATDPSGNVSDYSAPATFAIELARPVSLPTFTLEESYHVRLGELLTIQTNVTGGSGPYRYVLRWGDGLQSSGQTNGAITLTHRFEAAGSYNAALRVTDQAGGVAEHATVIYVSDSGTRPVVAPAVRVDTPGGSGLLDIPQAVASLPLWSLIIVVIGLLLPVGSALGSGGIRRIFWPLTAITQSLWYTLFVRSGSELGRHWGVVFDSLTKEPLSRVKVRLIPVDGIARGLETLTDHLGRYTFPPPHPHRSRLELHKIGYRFPSALVLGERDAYWNSLAPAGKITLKPGAKARFNIPADPEGTRARLSSTRLAPGLRRLFGLCALLLLGTSLVAQQIAVLSNPAPIEIIYGALLASLFLLNIATLVWEHHLLVPVGHLLDRNGNTLSGVQVTLSQGHRDLERRFTDEAGRFFFRARKGLYSLRVDSPELQIPHLRVRLSEGGFIAPSLQEAGLTAREPRRAAKPRRKAA